VYFQGKDITKYPPHKITRLGLVRSFQDVRIFPGMSVLDNVLIACPNKIFNWLWPALILSALPGGLKRWLAKSPLPNRSC
jgi:branched-chain amino acid transport system ATP-binding protein